MPKQKTNKGAAKRFKKTKHGKVKRDCAFAGHLLGPKNRKRKRKLRKGAVVSKSDSKRIASMLHN